MTYSFTTVPPRRSETLQSVTFARNLSRVRAEQARSCYRSARYCEGKSRHAAAGRFWDDYQNYSILAVNLRDLATKLLDRAQSEED